MSGVDVGPVLRELLASNRGAPHYVVAGTLDGDVLSVALTFRGGATYCCFEWGCHLGLHEGTRWDRLRLRLQEHGVEPPNRLTLGLTVVVEDGAIAPDPSRPDASKRGKHALRPWDGYGYRVTCVESSAAD